MTPFLFHSLSHLLILTFLFLVSHSLSLSSPLLPYILSDNGIDVTTTYCAPDLARLNLPGLWCFSLSLHTCGTVGGSINITQNANEIYSINIHDITDYEYTRNIGPCRTTFKAQKSTFALTPTYLKICTEAVTTCGPIVSPPVVLECQEVGYDCGRLTGSTCGECVGHIQCGFCGEENVNNGGISGGKCLFDTPNINNPNNPNPYCSNCAASSYLQTAQQCDEWDKERESRMNDNNSTPTSLSSRIALGVGLTLLFLIMIILIVLYVRRMKMKKKWNNNRQRLAHRNDIQMRAGGLESGGINNSREQNNNGMEDELAEKYLKDNGMPLDDENESEASYVPPRAL